MTRAEALQVLGLSGNPPVDEIIDSYHRHSKKFHPDRYHNHDENIRQVMHEKFIQITEAKNLLLNGQTSQSASYSDSASSSLEASLMEVERQVNRREFTSALSLLSDLVFKYGELPVLIQQRMTIHYEMEQFDSAYHDIRRLEILDRSLLSDPDFLHFKAVLAGETGAFPDAHAAIDDAMQRSSRPVPAYVATKAAICIREGNTRKADELLKHLSLIDPTNPLVKQRATYMNVGGQYVDKGDAVASGCIVCTLLECIFDCI